MENDVLLITHRALSSDGRTVLGYLYGTPDEFGWMAGDEWAGAPRGTHDDVADLCTRLRRYLAD